MASYKNQQRYLMHRGREFHFVSYEGQIANVAKQIHASPPTWYLISAGKRWEVMTQDIGETEEQCERRLAAWLDENVFKA
ncbi:MAG TPA: hypothetical protein VFX50_07750 [Gemmatimonadales bacterium]|jgi:hypothetical protein|nr:hypothetical protein [Gemmatimonadales bacterium]